jgi:diadenosine tetraphosphate (Ap4A) HIT family hydrolase
MTSVLPIRLASSANYRANHRFKSNPSAFTEFYFGPKPQATPLVETANAAVVMNLYPARQGHAMVISKAEIPLLKDVPAHVRHEMMDLVAVYQRMWLNLPQNKGKRFDFAVYVNDGPIAAQTVPHAHIHIVPIAEHLPMSEGSIREALNKTVSNDKLAVVNQHAGKIDQLLKVFLDNTQHVVSTLKQESTQLYSQLLPLPPQKTSS